MSEFKNTHKLYLKEKGIKDEYELANHIEGLKEKKLDFIDRQMLFDLIFLMVNEKDNLSQFFYAENNSNSTRHKSKTGETHVFVSTPTETIDEINNMFKKGVIKNSNKCSLQCFCDGSCKKEQKLPIEIPKPVTFNKSDKDDVITNSNRGEKEMIEHLQGVKHNQLKPRLDAVINTQFTKALQLIALATEYGNSKYKETDLDMLNFKRVVGGSQTYFNASARHSTDRNGLDESGLPHIIHAVWSSLAGLELWAEENKIDIKKFTENFMKNLQD